MIERDLAEAELEILEMLDYNCLVDTVYTFQNLICKSILESSPLAEMSSEIQDRIVPIATKYLELSLLTSESLMYKPSTIAACSLWLATEEEGLDLRVDTFVSLLQRTRVGISLFTAY